MSNIITRTWGWITGNSSTNNQKGDQYTSPRSKAFARQKNPTLDQALQVSAFWAAVNRWSKTISSLPMSVQVYDEESKKWNTAYDHPLQKLLSYKVNRYQTQKEFMKEVVFNLVSTGNSFVKIDRANNQITSLLPLSSGQMMIKVMEDGTLVYVYERDGKHTAYAADSIWHLKTFGNNVVGMSPLAYGATAIGVGLSADERTTQVLDNAAKPSGVLTFNSDLKLTDKQRAQLKKEFKDLKEGTDNVLMTLESGWAYQQIGLSPEDIQLLESRKFTIHDIGRFLDMPSVLINDNSESKWGAGIQEIINGWYKLSLRPETDYIADSGRIHLIEAGQRRKTRIFFDFDSLLQLSRKERMEANQVAINSAQMTPNEARIDEGREPLDGGDDLLINTALQPVEPYIQNLANERGQQ